MKKLFAPSIALSILTASFASATLVPATDLSSPPSNDSFISYQWALMNRDQVVKGEVGDIHPKDIRSNPRIHINWKNFDSQMKREVIVAVLDTGLDSGHPEMKDRFLPGFNFTARDASREKLFDDDVGHGTHISGIIAANSGNGEGISGLSNKVKILPLKVYDSREGSAQNAGAGSSSAQKRSPITERVVKAIEMAIERKADLIHLSMGWPRIANTSSVEAAFKKAIDSGIIVVAAAGNDHHQGQVYPCAFKDVICVASVDIDGKISGRSNFGGHVDLAAPGQEIISLWPTLKLSDRLGFKGYELKSGTSQAAPFVTGALAILKGIYPNETPSQLRARLLSSTEPLPNTTLGLLNVQKAVASAPRSFPRPVFKGMESIEVNPDTLEFELPVRIDKDGSSRVNVQISTELRNVTLAGTRTVSENSQELVLQVKGRLSSSRDDNRLPYTVTVDGRRYENEILMSRPFHRLPLTKVAFPRPDLLKNGQLKTLGEIGHSSAIRYWATEKSGSNLKLYVWTLKNNAFEEKSVVLPNVSEIDSGIDVMAEDWNMDGVTDFLTAGLTIENDEAKRVTYFYLDPNLNISLQMPLINEGVRPRYRTAEDAMVGRMTVPGLGAIKVPVFWDSGLIPTKDQSQNDFDFEVNAKITRLYYLEPFRADNQWKMLTRTLMSGQFEKTLRERLQISTKNYFAKKASKGVKNFQGPSLDATQDLQGVGTKIQSAQDLKAGRIEVLLTAGRGADAPLFRVIFPDLTRPFESIQTQAVPQISFNFEKHQIKEALQIGTTPWDSETDFQAVYTDIAARSVVMRGDQFGGLKLTVPERGEDILGVVRSFTNGPNMVSFFETTDWLRAQGKWNSVNVDGKAAVFRSTFLPGSLFSQILVPVVAGPQRSPGIMVDMSSLFANLLTVTTVEANGQIVNSVGRTFTIPAHCLRKAPVMNPQGYSRLVFTCEQGNGADLYFLDLQ